MNSCDDTNSFEFLRIYHDGKLMSQVASVNPSASLIDSLDSDLVQMASDPSCRLSEILGGLGTTDPLVDKTMMATTHHRNVLDVNNNCCMSDESTMMMPAAAGHYHGNGERHNIYGDGSGGGGGQAPRGDGRDSGGYLAEQLSETPSIYSMEFVHKYPNISNFRDAGTAATTTTRDSAGEASSQVKEKLKTHIGKKASLSSNAAAAAATARQTAKAPGKKTGGGDDRASLTTKLIDHADNIEPDYQTPVKTATVEASLATPQTAARKRKHKSAASAAAVTGEPPNCSSQQQQQQSAVVQELIPVGPLSQPPSASKKSKARKQAPPEPTTGPSGAQNAVLERSKQMTAAMVGMVGMAAASSSPPATADDEKQHSASKRMKTLPELATNIMKEWFDAHRDRPYPKDEERREMAIAGNISESQVKAWFANKRNRTNNSRSKTKPPPSEVAAKSSAEADKSAVPSTTDGEPPVVHIDGGFHSHHEQHSSYRSAAAASAIDLFNSNSNNNLYPSAFNSPLLIEKTSTMSLYEMVNTPPLQIPPVHHRGGKKTGRNLDRQYYLDAAHQQQHAAPQMVLTEAAPHLSQYGGTGGFSMGPHHYANYDGLITAASHQEMDNNGPESVPHLASSSSSSSDYSSSCYSINSRQHLLSSSSIYCGDNSCGGQSTNECSSYCPPNCCAAVVGYRSSSSSKASSSFIHDQRSYYHHQVECSSAGSATKQQQHHGDATSYPTTSGGGGPYAFLNTNNLNAINTSTNAAKYAHEMTFNSYNAEMIAANRYGSITTPPPPPIEQQLSCYVGGGGGYNHSWSCNHLANSLPDTPSGTYSNPVSSVSSVSSSCDGLNMTNSSYNSSNLAASYSAYFSSAAGRDLPSGCGGGDYSNQHHHRQAELNLSHPFDCDAFLDQHHHHHSGQACFNDMASSAYSINHGSMSMCSNTMQDPDHHQSSSSWYRRHESHHAGDDEYAASHQQASCYEFNDTFTGQYQSADHSTNDYMDNLDLFVCDDFLEKDSTTRLLTKIIAESDASSSLSNSFNEAAAAAATTRRTAWLASVEPLTPTFQQHE